MTRILAVSSGLSPCGIADYHAALVAGFGDRAAVTTVPMPTDLAPRSRPWRLLRRRAWVKGLARRADGFDAVLVQYHPRFWNHVGRRGEDLFPLFAAAVRRPVLAVVHEPPDPIREGPPSGPGLVRRAKGLNVRFWEVLNTCSAGPSPFARCAAVVVHSPELRDGLTAAGVPPARVHYHLHPIFPLVPPAWPREEVDRRFGLAGKRVAVVVGFPDPRKGFDLAVRAVAALPPDVALVWAGGSRGGADEAALLRLVDTLGLGPRFVRTGYLGEPELNAVLARADVALAPFRQVTGSGSIARFLAAGVPVVASDLPPIRELRAAGAGIELAPPDDAAALTAATADLLSDAARRAGAASRTRAFAAAFGFEALLAQACWQAPWRLTTDS